MDKIVIVNGVRLVRREQVGPRGGRTYLYQAENASRDWGFWYGSAQEAARRSNPSDKVVRV